MTELDQWCEIDGHEWITIYLSHGLVLGSKTTHMMQHCDICKIRDDKIFKPISDKIFYPLYPPMINIF